MKKPALTLPDDWYDLATKDGRMRAIHDLHACRPRCESMDACPRECRGIEKCQQGRQLPAALADVLVDLLIAGQFPAAIGRPGKRVHEQMRDDLRGLAAKAPGSSALDAGERDRIYRPNRKRASPKKK